MATASRTILVRFDGATAGLRRASREASQALDSVNKPVMAVTKGLAALGGAGGAVQVLAGVAGAAAQLAPAALILPGALLAAGAAMATLKLATAGFADAVSAADPAAFAEATKDMAPAAVATAQALRDMRPQFTELKKAVQGRFFEGFADDARELGRTYLPVLSKGMSGIAGRMNDMARSAADALMKPAAVADVNKVLGNTDSLFANMKDTLANLVSGFLGLANIGSTYLPALGTAIDDAAAKFKAWVDTAGEERIKVMIDTALQGFSDLGAAIGNVTSAAALIFTGLGSGGATFLTTLKDVTAALAEFFGRTDVQATLGLIGEAMAAAGLAVKDVFLAALEQLMPVIDFLAPIVRDLAVWISQNATAIAAVALVLIGLNVAFQVFTTVLGLVRTAVLLLNVAMALNPFGMILIGIGLLVGAFIWAYTNSETFRNIVNGAFQAVSTFVTDSVENIKGVIAWFGSLPGLFSGWVEGARRAVVDKFNGAVSFVTGLPGRFMDALGNLGGLLSGAGAALVDGFKKGISRAWEGLMGMARDLMGNLRKLWPFSPAKEGPFSGSGYVTHSGRAMTEDFAQSLRDGQPGIIAAARDVMDSAAGPLRAGLAGGPGGLAAAAKEALSHLQSGGRLFEDFSFRGNSGNLRQWNDTLATRFQQSGSGDMTRFLQDMATTQQGPAPTYVTVMIDGQEFRGMVKTEIAGANRDTRLDVSNTFRRAR